MAGVNGADLAYSRDIQEWREVPIPPKADVVEREIWDSPPKWTPNEWFVSFTDGKVQAELKKLHAKRSGGPEFAPTAELFGRADSYYAVDDGWLIGFNNGEFGGALYWFSRDGTNKYRISRHQIVDFFVLRNEIHAIEGLAHRTISRGSVIRIAKGKESTNWQASVALDLGQAPTAVIVRTNGNAFIALSSSLILLDSDYKVATLDADRAWPMLYPRSLAFPEGGQKLYMGMRQFVGEFDLQTRKVKLLVPSEEFMNRLSKEDIDRIRRVYDLQETAKSKRGLLMMFPSTIQGWLVALGALAVLFLVFRNKLNKPS